MKYYLTLLLLLTLRLTTAQEYRQYDRYMNPNDSLMLINLPELKLPDSYKNSKFENLPDYHNNSDNEFFRPIFSQYGWSCGQASTVGYNFTYEMNRLNNTSASLEQNQYPPIFAFNFFNNGQDGVGVCYLYTLDAIKHNGTPNVTDYGSMGESLTHWADGYDIYYSGMFNRVDEIYSIHVGDEEGLMTLKQYLYDHLDGSETGGIVNFYTDLYSYTTLPAGTPEAGKAVITEFGPYTGHSMTFLGWNDSIRWDYNNDGQYTNDIDITGDGEVTMKDWEIGGVILANSWGNGWADEGFCYVMYNVLAKEKMDGGIWNKMVNVIKVKENYEPKLTFKIKLTHDSRNKIKVVTGVSNDTASALPQHLLEFPIFNYQGGDYYMQGINSLNSYKTLEFGLDVTPLLSYITPGEPAKFFLQVHENDPDELGTGSIDNFSLMDYTDGLIETACADTDVPLNENGVTTLSIIQGISWDDVEITNEDLPAFTSSETYTAQMTASGGTDPYTWDVAPVYSGSGNQEDYPVVDGVQIYPNNNQTGYATQALGFQFPFFDRFIDTVYMHVDGFLQFDESPYPLPYQIEDMLVFKNEAIIAAFLNKNIEVIGSSGNKLWFEGDENHATFRWQVSVKPVSSSYPLDVSVTLYPDGTIDIHHDEYNFPTQFSRITGISNGDAINFLLEDPVFATELSVPEVFRYTPLNYPAETTISADGLLSFLPGDDDKIYSVAVRVTDDAEVSSTRIFQLSSGMIYDHEIVSGNDNQVDYGETTFVNFTLKNNGSETLNDIVLTLQTDDPYVQWLDDSESVAFMAPGESVQLDDAVSFVMGSIYPDGHSININVYISSTEANWESRFSLTAHAPTLFAGTPEVIDGDNGRLDPGETADIIIPLFNSGLGLAEGVQAFLSVDGPYLTINGNTELSYGDIPGGQWSSDTVNVTIQENAPQGQKTIIYMDITVLPDIQLSDSVMMLIGRYPVLVVDLDPEVLSGPYIVEALDQLEVNYTYTDYLPSNLDLYSNLLVTLGRNFGQHVLTQAEGEKLADFLTNGGNLYMEGGKTWYDDPQTAVHPYFNLEALYVSWTQVDSVVGNEDTFLDSLKFDYDGDVMYYNNHLIPQGAAFAVLHASDENHNFAVAYAGEDYKTIGSILDFGGLVDGPVPSTRYHLLGRILEFFDLDVVIVGDGENMALAETGNLTVYPNPIKDRYTVEFTLGDRQPVTVSIMDIHGNEVVSLAKDKVFGEGLNTATGSLAGLPPAVYICTIKTATSMSSTRLIKIQ